MAVQKKSDSVQIEPGIFWSKASAQISAPPWHPTEQCSLVKEKKKETNLILNVGSFQNTKYRHLGTGDCHKSLSVVKVS